MQGPEGTVRQRRLKADYDSIKRLVRVVPRIKVDGVRGNPPEQYRFVISARSLRQEGAKLVFVDTHRVEVRLPLGYPRDPPYCRMLTPVFHPNIAPHAICIGDQWAAGEALDLLVLQIRQMLAFQNYNVKSPLNGEAAKWVAENASMLPLDRESFQQIDDAAGPSKVSARTDLCSNCGDTLGDGVSACAAGHILCGMCAADCEHEHHLICLACGIIDCPECARPSLACFSGRA